jgi:two-component system KDP operon response regulator KdpE
MKILLVGADLELIEEVSLTLKQYQPDWQLSVISSGVQGLALLKGNQCPDLAIIGMQLSDMSGFELIECIRDDSEIPIIFLSRDRDVNTLVKAFDAGACDYVEAPFNKATFFARIKAKLRRYKWDIQSKGNNSLNVNTQRVMCNPLPGKSEY